mgnify:CR=1 FL=1
MGPPIFIGGNPLSQRHTEGTEPLQWGRRFSSAEMATVPLRRVYASKLQWGRRFSSAEIFRKVVGSCHSPNRFNGAADFHRRKCETPDAQSARPLCFNGAADFHRRKYPVWHVGTEAVAGLQWGRRFSSAEIFMELWQLKRIKPLQWGRRFSSAEIWTRAGMK